MPDRGQMAINSAHIYENYKLWNVVCGIDGCHIPFDDKPRYNKITNELYFFLRQ